jgi:hypothetical protein
MARSTAGAVCETAGTALIPSAAASPRHRRPKQMPAEA